MKLTNKELFDIATMGWISGGFDIKDCGVDMDTLEWMKEHEDYVTRKEEFNQQSLNGELSEEQEAHKLKNLDREFDWHVQISKKRDIIQEIIELGNELEANMVENGRYGMKSNSSNLRAKAKRRLAKLTKDERDWVEENNSDYDYAIQFIG